jgi:hypothetical protein
LTVEWICKNMRGKKTRRPRRPSYLFALNRLANSVL